MANEPAAQPSPFEIVTPAKSKKGSKGLVVGILVVLFLILSVIAGVLLVRQNQNVQEKAAECPALEACPYAQDPTLLRNCTPPEADNSPAESVCNVAGRVESCGGKEYCCPSVGASWTLNMAACPSPTATATASPEATIEALVEQATTEPTASSAATPTTTATATSLATLAPVGTSTPLAIPVTGTSWPTILGAGVGIVVIIASILIAL